ncbi:hypothetical protein XELAEV_18045323mg [Xenopus laevis]|uniref:Uncharacterized protein n=1 Tax=Xenopus laevis TaxID=8355 RepID=A0A974C0S0_XENLA|nr:hypothetical protein XELAEV_18045323mg [Xenopus laevis]
MMDGALSIQCQKFEDSNHLSSFEDNTAEECVGNSVQEADHTTDTDIVPAAQCTSLPLLLRKYPSGKVPPLPGIYNCRFVRTSPAPHKCFYSFKRPRKHMLEDFSLDLSHKAKVDWLERPLLGVRARGSWGHTYCSCFTHSWFTELPHSLSSSMAVTGFVEQARLENFPLCVNIYFKAASPHNGPSPAALTVYQCFGPQAND